MRRELLKYQLVVMVPPLENGMNQCLGWLASLMQVQELQDHPAVRLFTKQLASQSEEIEQKTCMVSGIQLTF